MRTFISLVSEDEEVQKLAEQVASFPITQGLVIEVHPLWRLCWWLLRRGGDINHIEHFYDLLLHDPFPRPMRHWTRWWLGTHDVADYAEFEVFPDYDYNWKPRFWDSSLKPLAARVIVRPWNEDEAEQRKELLNVVKESPIHAIIEDRPVAQLLLSGGDRISVHGIPNASFGTLGGFLGDQNGKVYGATCAHVLTAGCQVVDAQATLVGNCSHHEPPQPNRAGALCHPRDQNAVCNELDVALIRLNARPQSSQLTGWTWRYQSGQKIAMAGATTARNPYIVGGLAVFFQFPAATRGGPSLCFRNLFEVRPSSRFSVFGPRIGQAISPIPQPGDSGAWVEASGSSGAEWCGMLIGTDSVAGYAVPSETIVSWADNKHRLTLSVI